MRPYIYKKMQGGYRIYETGDPPKSAVKRDWDTKGIEGARIGGDVPGGIVREFVTFGLKIRKLKKNNKIRKNHNHSLA